MSNPNKINRPKEPKRKLGSLKSYDPRTKLYLIVLLTAIMAVGWKWQVMVIGVAMAFVLIAIIEVDITAILRSYLNIVAVAILVSAIVSFTVSIKIGAFTAIKLLLLIIVAGGISKTMKQAEVLDALSQGFGLGAGASKRLSAILTFLPHVGREKARVRMAQRARGVNPYEGNIISRFRKDLMLAIPNYKCTYIKSKRQLVAMEMHQYTSTKRRSRVQSLKFMWVDELMLILYIIMLLVSILLMIVLK
jgi:energy-coupling factor transporter transmembrane protein EcfT